MDRGFESGEAFFEGAGDGEESEESGFGDVSALVGVGEQGCAQESTHDGVVADG